MSNTISDRIFKDTSEKKMLNKFDILYVLFIVFLSFFSELAAGIISFCPIFIFEGSLKLFFLRIESTGVLYFLLIE